MIASYRGRWKILAVNGGKSWKKTDRAPKIGQVRRWKWRIFRTHPKIYRNAISEISMNRWWRKLMQDKLTCLDCLLILTQTLLFCSHWVTSQIMLMSYLFQRTIRFTYRIIILVTTLRFRQCNIKIWFLHLPSPISKSQGPTQTLSWLKMHYPN